MKHLLSVTLLLIFFTGCVDRNQHRRMQMLLAETEAQDANCQWFTSDSLALSLVDYFSVYGTKSERAKAYYLLGRAYDNLGESSMAVLCYREASSTADTTDARMIARLHAYIGKQYVQYKSNSTDIATLGIQELRTAVRYAAMLNDTLLMRDCNQLISIVSEHLHRNDSLRGFKWKHRQDSC